MEKRLSKQGTEEEGQMTTTPPGVQKARKDGAAMLLFEHLCHAEEERDIQKTAKDTPEGLLLAILFSL